MKKLLSLLAIIWCCLQVHPSYAQNNLEGQIIASDYGAFQVPGIATGSLHFEPATCQVSAGSKNFAAFTTGVPLKIVDSNPNLNEIDTPAAVFINDCSISMSTSHIHATPFYVTSGTGGLQEALINGPSKAGGANTVILNADWYTQVLPGNPATVIAAVKGSTALGLVDVTTSPYTTYSWNGSAYVVNASGGGGTIPATTNVLKGNGSAGVSVAATPGTDYVLPTGNITGTAGNLSGTPALSNGITATTQTTGDNTTKLATDAFVVANTGGAAFPPTNNVVFNTGVGTSRNATSADLNALYGYTPLSPSAIPTTPAVIKGDNAGNLTAATPGTDFFPATIAGLYGQVPVSTAAGGLYSAQAVPLSFGSFFDQFIVQQDTVANWTTQRVNDLNSVFHVEGFINSGVYGGVGVAQVAWSSGVNEPLCQATSFGGNNYIAVNTGNGSVTPGTNFQYWQPVPNAQASTAFDCAAYTAATYAVGQSVNPTVEVGGGYYSTNGIVMPSGLYSVNFKGCGEFCTYLTYTGSTYIPVFQKANGGNFPSVQIKDMTINGNFVASSIMQLYGLGESYIDNIAGINPAPQTGAGGFFFKFGDGTNISFQVHLSNIETNIVGGSTAYGEPSTYASVTPNIVGGAITSYTINSGGNGQPQGGLVMQWLGSQGGTSNKPCTTLPDQPTLTYNGSGVLTGITPGTGKGVGCSGTIDVQIHSIYPIDYSIVLNSSDLTAKDLIVYQGAKAGIQVNYGNVVLIHPHPCCINVGIQNFANTTIEGAELDAIYNYGIDFEQGSSLASSVSDTNAYSNGRIIPGSVAYNFGTGIGNVNFGTQGALCSSSKPADWHEFMTTAGPTDLGATFPAGVHVNGNDSYCATTGDVIATPAAGPALLIGTANNNAHNYAAFGPTNGYVGWSPTNQETTLQAYSGGGISFNLSNTFGSGKIGGFAPFGEEQLAETGSTAAASTVNPFGGAVTLITGTGTIDTITANSGCTIAGIDCTKTFVSVGGFSTSTSGNIGVAFTTTAGYAYLFTYSPTNSKWYPTH